MSGLLADLSIRRDIFERPGSLDITGWMDSPSTWSLCHAKHPHFVSLCRRQTTRVQMSAKGLLEDNTQETAVNILLIRRWDRARVSAWSLHRRVDGPQERHAILDTATDMINPSPWGAIPLNWSIFHSSIYESSVNITDKVRKSLSLNSVA